MLFLFDDEFDDEFDDNFDDEFDDGLVDDEEDQSTPQKKKKGSFLFNLIIVVICLGGAGFAYMKFMGGTQPVSNTAAVQDTQTDVPVAEEVQQEISNAASETLNASDDFMTSFEEETGEDTQALDQEIVFEEDQNSDMSFFDEVSTEETAQSDVVSIDQEELSDFSMEEQAEEDVTSSAAAEMFDFESPESENIETVQNTSVEVTTPDVAVNDPSPAILEKIEAVLGRMDSIENRISGLEETQKSLSDMSMESKVEMDMSIVDDLRAEISSLKTKLNKLEAQPKASSAPVQPVKKVQTEVKQESKSIQNIAPSKWVIKSAQPGRALLSSGRNSGTVSVKVGDTLSQIGRIKFIGINPNGLWEIKGSDASIVEPR